MGPSRAVLLAAAVLLLAGSTLVAADDSYCCAGSCPIPVPKPPSFAELAPAPTVTPSGAPVVQGSEQEIEAFLLQQARPTTLHPGNMAPHDTGRRRKQPSALGFCTAGVRNPVSLPGPVQAQGAAKLFIAKRFDPLPATCNFTLPEHLARCTGPEGCISECSGNTLSDGLILAAAHCFDANFLRLRLRRMLGGAGGYPADIATDPCGINTLKVEVTAVMACYDYDQMTDDAPLEACRPDRRYVANGVSWWPRPALSEAQPLTVHGAVDTIIPAPYDHSIVFLAQPVTHLPPDAYYKYNYRDNYPSDTPINVESYSYIGACGNDPTNKGEPCPTVACELSHTGPAAFPRPTTMGDSSGPESINMPITSFAGSSGSCALHAPDGCCYATSSWGITTCMRNCLGNFYSPIMSTRPLSELWKARQVVLPSPTSFWTDNTQEEQQQQQGQEQQQQHPWVEG